MRLYDFNGNKYTKHELDEKANNYLHTMENIISKAKAEKRQLTAAEKTDYDRLQEKYEKLNNFIEFLNTPVNQPLYAQPRQEREGFKSLGEQLSAIAVAGMPGGSFDNRLFSNDASGMSAGVPSDGGFLIQKDFTTELMRRVYDTAIIAPRCLIGRWVKIAMAWSSRMWMKQAEQPVPV